MKKTAAVVMILLILLCALCPAACAEGGEALQKGDILYFGVYEEEPIRWLVLDPAATNAGTPGIFLLSEHMLANQGVVYSWARAVWQGSEGQAWCSNMLETAFSEAERAAIPAVGGGPAALRAELGRGEPRGRKGLLPLGRGAERVYRPQRRRPRPHREHAERQDRLLLAAHAARLPQRLRGPRARGQSGA